jgi:hypothetical protein
VHGVVEHDSVFPHQVVDVPFAAAEREALPGDRVEAEEHFFAVEDVELEQRRAGMGADLGCRALKEPEAGEFLHVVKDRMGVPGCEPGGAFPVVRVVGQVIGAAREHHGPGRVGEQHPDGDAGGPDPPDPDLVERFLDDAVQRLTGEPGEVDRDMLAGERLLDKRADADGRRGENRRAGRAWCRHGGSAGLATCIQQFGGGRLEELLSGPAGEHLL